MASKKSVSSKAGKQATKAKPAKGTPPAKAKVLAKAKAPAKVKAKAPAKAKPAPAKPAPKAAKALKAAPASAPKAKPQKQKQGSAMVHWEIQSTQPEALHEFYTEIFGWQIDADNPMKYGMVSSKSAAGGIDGGIGGSQDGSSRIVVYTSVPSITETLERIEDRGGMTIMPRTDIGYVVMALYRDPEGNTMGLLEDR